MSDEIKEIDDHSGVETTGHEWDGIKELNNPLPRWWLIVWYATIAFSVVYMVLFPALPGLPGLGTSTRGILDASDRTAVGEAVDALKSARAVDGERLLSASLEEIETDRSLQQFALAMGESLFGDNCATCHGAGGRGAPGYPILADDVWLWDGTLEGIEYTIRHGIRHEGDELTRFSAMPSFGGFLTNAQIRDMVEYVLHFSGQSEDEEAVARSLPIWESQCLSCHGAEGLGDRSQGAPNLADATWQFGGDRDAIYETIYDARNVHMPAWSDRLDEPSIRALSVYVHALGGGE